MPAVEAPSRHNRSASAGREIIFEFQKIGRGVKIFEVDTATGAEVSIVGDPRAGEGAFRLLARHKLDYVLTRRGAG